MAHQKFWEIFHGLSIYAENTSWPPQKPSGPPPTYLMYGLLHIQGVHNLILLAFFFIIFAIRWTFANCMNMEGVTFFYVLLFRNLYKRTKKVWKRIQTMQIMQFKICVMKSSLKIFDTFEILLFFFKQKYILFLQTYFLKLLI